jgi:hypothetical protein
VATVFADSPIHVVRELSKPQPWNNGPMKQAFSILSPTYREQSGLNHNDGTKTKKAASHYEPAFSVP